jgi:hypothetical protein
MTTGLKAQGFWERVKLGIQTDLEYDRASTGSLTGAPDTKTYALNSLTSGGLMQVRLNGFRPLPRFFVVIAPFQFQQEITRNNYTASFTPSVGIGHVITDKAGTDTVPITVTTPRWNGFSQRAGFRYEAGGNWTGSYAEGGGEYLNTNRVFSGLLMPDLVACSIKLITYSECVGENLTSSGAQPTALTQTLHAGGAYWTIHGQRPLVKSQRLSFTFDSQGDSLFEPGVRLPTETRYAFTTSEALNVKVFGNLVLAPAVTQFFYENQRTTEIANHSLRTDTFMVTAKWYFDRDAAVPFPHQAWFAGPASKDQTKTAKIQ